MREMVWQVDVNQIVTCTRKEETDNLGKGSSMAKVHVHSKDAAICGRKRRCHHLVDLIVISSEQRESSEPTKLYSFSQLA
jgi:hypothetical protein